jgi:SWI/SNF-related matrix-associated actin-dependent regulator 1 of chromatin subfamily A
MINSKKIIDFFSKSIEPNEIIRINKSRHAKIFYNNGICLDHPYNEEMVTKYHFFKSIKWNKQLKVWELVGNLDFEVAKFLIDINKEFDEYYWTIDSESLNILKEFLDDFEIKQKQHKNIMQIKRSKKISIDWQTELKVEPYNYQKVGIKFIEANNGIAFLGDDMGVGKTMQAIGYTAINNLRTIIVCPASLKYNWEKEIKDFTKNKKSLILSDLDAGDKIPNTFDYYIINYDQVKKYVEQIKKLKLDCIVLDESQYVKESSSDRQKAVKSLNKIGKRILLSGTAIKNRVMEFYTQLNFLRPDIFPNKEKFGLRYCDAKRNPHSKGFIYAGASNLKELNSRISPFYIRRLKTDVLDLPEKEIKIINYELNPNQKKSYDLLKKEFNKNLINLDKRIVLSKTVKMKQIVSSYKLEFLKDFVENLQAGSSSGKIIIFSQFIHTQKMVLEMFKDQANSIFGEYSAERRDQEVKEFQQNPDKKIIVVSSIAGGVGLNLPVADKVIFLDLLWNILDHKQCEDRAYRNGQKNSVNVYYIIAKDTVDELIWSLFDRKDFVIKQIIDDSVKDLNIEDKFLNLLIENTQK